MDCIKTIGISGYPFKLRIQCWILRVVYGNSGLVWSLGVGNEDAIKIKNKNICDVAGKIAVLLLQWE